MVEVLSHHSPTSPISPFRCSDAVPRDITPPPLSRLSHHGSSPSGHRSNLLEQLLLVHWLDALVSCRVSGVDRALGGPGRIPVATFRVNESVWCIRLHGTASHGLVSLAHVILVSIAVPVPHDFAALILLDLGLAVQLGLFQAVLVALGNEGIIGLDLGGRILGGHQRISNHLLLPPIALA